MRYRRHRFPQRYTRAAIELLAIVEEAHESLSGPATRRILQREYQHYGKPEYERLASISVAHLYNLRRQPRSRERRLNYTKTKPTAVASGERRRPDPQGQPGYLRIDTVHQGDQPGAQGVYPSNAVDQVTQWEIVSATARISEAWLEPVLAALLRQFPFPIRGVHSDNGSEFINQTVARLLNKLLIEQTKSRPRHSNHNGLVETKNGAVIRKHMGYGYIAAQHAEPIQLFYAQHLNPYLNYHRPCAQADIEVDEKGRKRCCVLPALSDPAGRPCWPCLSPPTACARGSASPSYNASPQPSAIPKPPSACSKPSANSLSSCGLRAWGDKETPGRKGGGIDGACKTLRVSHPPWKSLRDSHIPTAPTTARLVQYKNQERSFPQPPLQPSFRLILRLEKTLNVRSPRGHHRDTEAQRKPKARMIFSSFSVLLCICGEVDSQRLPCLRVEPVAAKLFPCLTSARRKSN